MFICNFLTRAVLLLKSVDYGRMAEILVQRAASPDEFTRLTAITWVSIFCLFPYHSPTVFIVNVLDMETDHCFVYRYRIWIVLFMCFVDLQINEFVKLGGDQLVPYYADILGAILPCISDKEEKIRVVGLLVSIPFFVFVYFFSCWGWWCLFDTAAYCGFIHWILFSSLRLLAKPMKSSVPLRQIQLKGLMLEQSSLLQGGVVL